MRSLFALGFFLLSLAGHGPALAEEEVSALTTRIAFDAQGAAQVRHQITVRAEGDEIKRGIFFDIPSALGPISDVDVTRDGAEEPWELDDGSLRIGEEDVFLDPGAYRYEIRYRAATPFYADSQGRVTFSYRPLAAQFDLPWRQTDLEVTWPEGMGPLTLTPEGAGTLSGGAFRWAAEGGGAVPAFTFDYQSAVVPDTALRIQSVNDALRIAGPLALLLVLLLSHWTWLRVGKDRPAGYAPPRLDPPPGLSAAATRYVSQMGYDAQCFAAALVSLVTKGAVDLAFEDKKKVRLTRRNQQADLFPGEAALREVLFEKDDDLILGETNSVVGKGMTAHRKALAKEHQDRFWKDNIGAWLRLFFLALLLAILLFAGVIMEAQKAEEDSVAIILGIFPALLGVVVPLMYLNAMKAPTVAGRRIMDQIDGLKAALSSSEPLSRDAAPAEVFLKLLPFAVALDVEEDWQARFGDGLEAEGTTEARRLVAWYQEMRQQEDDMATFAAIIIPIISASSTSSAGTTGATVSAGATAGGW